MISGGKYRLQGSLTLTHWVRKASKLPLGFKKLSYLKIKVNHARAEPERWATTYSPLLLRAVMKWRQKLHSSGTVAIHTSTVYRKGEST